MTNTVRLPVLKFATAIILAVNAELESYAEWVDTLTGIVRKSLSDREWQCPACEMKHNRDRNAALNLRDEGIRQLAAMGILEALNACGVGVRPAKAGVGCQKQFTGICRGEVQVPHQEIKKPRPDMPCEAVVVRSGQDPVVVNLDIESPKPSTAGAVIAPRVGRVLVGARGR